MLYRNLLRLRHDRIVPGLSGAVSLGAVAIGDKAVLARWRLGDGSILTIACNLGDTLAIAHFPESEAAWGALDAGKAAPASTIVWIDAP
jgi:maltooligosyltrehalose trehalohydrolase